MLNMCSNNGACAGNSSSGIKETPFFGVPTVNIGSRQNSRLRSTNVIDTGYDKAEIKTAIRNCLRDKAFRKKCAACDNPYGIGNAGEKIAVMLAEAPTGKKMLQKKMTY